MAYKPDPDYLPLGSVVREEVKKKDGTLTVRKVIKEPPHLQRYEGSWDYFVIPKFDCECVGEETCYTYINRNYYCKKHIMKESCFFCGKPNVTQRSPMGKFWCGSLSCVDMWRKKNRKALEDVIASFHKKK